MAPRDPLDDEDRAPGAPGSGEAPDEPEVTARPTGREPDELLDEDGERVVPVTNVGGAAPTPLGLDSGGDVPAPGDELENLPEPEPPDAPEVSAVHVRRRREPEE